MRLPLTKSDKGSLSIDGLGAGNNGNCYNCRESPYLRLIFLERTYWPLRNPKKSAVHNFSPPPLRHVQIFSPPRPKNKKCPKYPKHYKNDALGTLKKFIKSKIFLPPFGGSPKFFAPFLCLPISFVPLYEASLSIQISLQCIALDQYFSYFLRVHL